MWPHPQMKAWRREGQHLKKNSQTGIFDLMESNLRNVPIAFTTRTRVSSHKPYRHSFRFEKYWTHHPECADVISTAWSHNVRGYPMFQVVEKIKNTQLALLSGHRTTFNKHQVGLRQVRSKLNSIDSQLFSASSLVERQALAQQLDSILAQEETY